MKISALKTFVAPPAGNFFVKVETDEGLYGIGEAGLRRRGAAADIGTDCGGRTVR